MRVVLTLLTLVLVATPALAKDREAKLRRFLELSGTLESEDNARKRALKKSIRDLRPNPEFERDLRKHADKAELAAKLLEAYSELDEETLDAAIAFFETPAGVKLRAYRAKLTPRDSEMGRQVVSNAVQLKMSAIRSNEASVAYVLVNLQSANDEFRGDDLDKNGKADFAADLGQLLKAVAKEPRYTRAFRGLEGGTIYGYRFQLCRGDQGPGRLWMAIASPLEPGNTGLRHFAINHSGNIVQSDEPFELDNDTCSIPERPKPRKRTGPGRR